MTRRAHRGRNGPTTSSTASARTPLLQVGAFDKASLGTYMDWGKTVIFKLERG